MQYAFVIHELANRENKRLYAESHFGALWNVANPLLFMIVMSTLYSTIFIHDIENFPVYFFTGILFYNFYKSATVNAMSSIVTNRVFLLQTKIPKNVFVIERVYAAFINFLYSGIAYILLLLFYRIKVGAVALLLPLDIILTVFVVLGIAKVLAIMYVFFEDISYLYSVFMTLMIFASALFYPIEKLSTNLQYVIGFNPIYISLAIARDCVLYGKFPIMTLWIKLGIWAVGSYLIGTLIFKFKENDVMQRI